MPISDSADIRPGFNVIGFVSGNFGLAVAARNTIEMLLGRGFDVRVVDLNAGGGRSGHDRTYAHLETPLAIETPYSINLFHANPPDVVNLLRDRPRWLDLAGRMNVCVPFWELPKLPVQDFIPVLSAMDMALCPTRFVLETVESSAPGARCLYYPQTAFVPDDIHPDQTAFGMDGGKTWFMTAFDLGSDIDRKNPWAAIDAFQLAFAGRADVGLIIKVNNPKLSQRLARGAERLQSLASEAPGVVLVDRALSYREVLTLYASCDVFVSLHRSEGLGLHLIEAMQLGKPVVATGWSGNMDFMTPENSRLIGYKLIPVVSAHPSYAPRIVGEGQVWAEPNIEAAVLAMRQLADDTTLRRQLGEKARSDALAQQRKFLAGRQMDYVLDAWSRRDAVLPDHNERTAALEATRRVTLYRQARRLAGGTLRKLRILK